jgi:hypothetical protein
MAPFTYAIVGGWVGLHGIVGMGLGIAASIWDGVSHAR